MGFIYQGSKLCCDACPTAGARKIRCPFGYCQAVALCPACRKTRKDLTSRTSAYHAGCEAGHAAFVAREATKAAALASGAAVRYSAVRVDDPTRVHVLFQYQDGVSVGYYVSPAAYAAVPLGSVATPATFAAFGPITLAPPAFVWAPAAK